MKREFLGLLTTILLMLALASTAMGDGVEVLGGLDVLGTPGTDGITFPDGTKQTTAGGSGTVTSVGTAGGLTGGPITGSGTISIAPTGVTDSMLATGISGSKISGNIPGNAASITGSIPESQVTNLVTDLGNKAAKGANSDITSLSGLTTPLSISQGGTGATTAAEARTNICAGTAPPKAPVLSSGQLITYAEGDDGNFKYGAVVTGSRFTDNGNGTVTDNLTSLIWLKNANCFSTYQTWATALNYANALASGSCGLTDGSLAGDWRLPNLNELESLIDASQFGPALPIGNPFTNVQNQNSYYWSSTTYADYADDSWDIDTYHGHVEVRGKADASYVWPVRGGRGKIGLPQTGETINYGTGADGALQKGVAWPTLRFTDNSDGTATDNLTGLIWLKNANCYGAQAWANAVSSANALANGSCGLTDGSLAGDWRLPNRKELKSLVDASKSNPALPPGYPFTNLQSVIFWSSTTTAADAGSAWAFDMYDGYMGQNDKRDGFYVWPVRGGR